MNISKKITKVYFTPSIFAWGEEICEHTNSPIGGPTCCISCKHNKGFDFGENWVKCQKGK